MRTTVADVADRIDRQAVRSAHRPTATPTRRSRSADGARARGASPDTRVAERSSLGWIHQTRIPQWQDRCPSFQTISSAPDQPLRTPKSSPWRLVSRRSQDLRIIGSLFRYRGPWVLSSEREPVMRLIVAVSTACILLSTTPASAQGWTDFVSKEDGFRVNFPGRPRVSESTYTSEYGADLPARVYTVVRGAERYSMTVVDYRPIEKILTEKAKKCPPFADERCTGFGAGAIVGAGYWKTDVRGALVWASWQFMQRNVKVTHYMWNFIDLVEGHQLQLTSNVDRSRTFVAIYMHENRLYLLEGTVPDGAPEPGLFQQSLGFVDKDGNTIRYRDYYDNDFPPPPRTGSGPGPGGNPAGPPPGAGR